MDALSRQQLSLLGQVADLFERAGIDYWLFGGWAVDFYAGHLTREHDDLDLAVWLADLPRIADLLDGDGWRHAPDDDEDGGTGYESSGVRLELTFLERRAGGRVLTPLRQGAAEWPQRTFGSEIGELAGVRSRLVALESLKRGKASPREDPVEAAKDEADFRKLSELGA